MEENALGTLLEVSILYKRLLKKIIEFTLSRKQVKMKVCYLEGRH